MFSGLTSRWIKPRACVVQRFGDRTTNRYRRVERKLALSAQPLPQGATLHVRKYEVELTGIFTGVEERCNPRMIQPFVDSDLPQESVGGDALG